MEPCYLTMPSFKSHKSPISAAKGSPVGPEGTNFIAEESGQSAGLTWCQGDDDVCEKVVEPALESRIWTVCRPEIGKAICSKSCESNMMFD